MAGVIGFFIGLFVGGFFGIVTTALLIVSEDEGRN